MAASWQSIRQDIASMRIRGATAISAAGARGVALAAKAAKGPHWRRSLRVAARQLAQARPTAVSLRNGVAVAAQAALAQTEAVEAAGAATTAAASWRTSLESGKAAIARTASRLLPKDATVLVHCHSTTVVGALAQAHRDGRGVRAIVCETRPWRQGLVTAKQLAAAGVPCTFIVDSAAGHVLREGMAQTVLVGADTVCRDGTVVNKVGTATVALLARDCNVPFIVASSTCKFTHDGPPGVAIEERPAAEVAGHGDLPARVKVFNPVFDRTRAALVHRIVTEDGAATPRVAARQALRSIPKEVPW